MRHITADIILAAALIVFVPLFIIFFVARIFVGLIGTDIGWVITFVLIAYLAMRKSRNKG